MNGPTVTVISDTTSREHYRLVDRDNWAYRLDLSAHGGWAWNEGQVEMMLRRVE